MRTTLSIDDDVLTAAKAIAQQRGQSLGDVVSDLARRALRRPQPGAARNGFVLLSRRDDPTVVTLDTVNTLQDEAP